MSRHIYKRRRHVRQILDRLLMQPVVSPRTRSMTDDYLIAAEHDRILRTALRALCKRYFAAQGRRPSTECLHSLVAASRRLGLQLDGTRPVSRTFVLRERMKIAAAVALIVLGSAAITYDALRPAPALPSVDLTAARRAAMVHVHTAAAAKLVSLSDGTRVRLGANSTLIFPEAFSATSREVTLEGRAHFEVAADAQKPFSVHSDPLIVRVLGTVFNIDRQSSKTAVELEKGSIEVVNDHARLVMSPGERLEYDAEKATMRLLEEEPAPALPTPKTAKQPPGETLTEIFEQIASYHHISLTYDRAHFAASDRFLFRVDAKTGALETLNQLAQVSGAFSVHAAKGGNLQIVPVP